MQRLWFVGSSGWPSLSWFVTTSTSLCTSKNCSKTHQITGDEFYRILVISLFYLFVQQDDTSARSIYFKIKPFIWKSQPEIINQNLKISRTSKTTDTSDIWLPFWTETASAFPAGSVVRQCVACCDVLKIPIYLTDFDDPCIYWTFITHLRP